MENSNITKKRLTDINLWLKHIFSSNEFQLEPASNDASFRRYFRVTVDSETLILMDAPPAQEDTQPFINIATFMYKYGINVPRISAYDSKAGFLLLTDFGHRAYLDELNEQSANALYEDAINSLLSMQLLPADEINIPEYNLDLLLQEMSLFPEWFLNRHLSIEAPTFLDNTFKLLADSALEQPQVFVHRDYHSRNLMHTQQNSPGIIDFQDAVVGAITYDLVSLLRDCYVEWPDDKLALWIKYYHAKATDQALLNNISLEKFTQWFDWMGLQRHIKVLGIFARLAHRDGKTQFLDEIPLTYQHCMDELDALSLHIPLLNT